MNDELDLHGCTITGALDIFVRTYNEKLGRKDKSPIRVIHGYGASGNGGEIRKRLRKFLEKYPQKTHFERGEQTIGNPGITIVFPEKLLPTPLEGLALDILIYCQKGKSEEKIIGKYRRYGQLEVKAQLRDLERLGRISTYRKGKYKYYLSEN